MIIATAVREARKAIGLTQDALAQRSGLSRRAINLLESGGGRVSSLVAVMPVLALRLTNLPTAPTLGEQLARARVRRKLTQAQVAQSAGISLPTLRALEQGGGSIAALDAALRVLAPEARRRRPARATWNDNGDVRLTPPEWLAAIEAAFGPISLDPCWHPSSFVTAQRTIDERENGLTARWSGQLAFVNPPFSDLSRWIHRCADAIDNKEVNSLVALLPARFETAAFQDRVAGAADLLIVRNKPRFFDAAGQRLSIATFGIHLACWGCDPVGVRLLAERVGGRVFWAHGVD